ncbi:hypothetical protein Dip510_001617 [Elusimicrobium posterum]|uniref:hypothetical protein n=1 Tax=Elusimicrobium posterum TaxID=3116653 RepID=UPI003C77A7AF
MQENNKLTLDMFVLFDLKTEKLTNKTKFLYLTHKGQGLYYKAKTAPLSKSGKDYFLAPQRHMQKQALECMAKNMAFETEIRDHKGNLQ